MMNPKNTGHITFKKMIQWCKDFEKRAAVRNSRSILKLLKRFPTDTTDDVGNTLLLHCVIDLEDDNDEIIKYLIDAGFEVNAENDKGFLALTEAIIRNKIKTFKILIKYGAITDHRYYSNHIGPLHCAAKEVCIEMLQLLLEAGCNVNAKDSKNWTPLDYVLRFAREKAVEGAKILLDAGASRDHTYYDKGFGPLHRACLDQDFNMVKLLIDAGYKVSVKDGYGDTPLHYLMLERRHPYDDGDDVNAASIIKLLIQAGADVNAKNGYGKSPLHFAVSFSYNNAFDLLRKAGAELNAVDEDGDTLLHMTDGDEHIYLAKRLIEAGADINKINSEGQSCLFNVVRCASVELLTYFIQHGAKLDLIDCYDTDLLGHILERWGSNDYSEDSQWYSRNQKLSDRDADVENNFGKDKIESQVKCIEILCKHGIDVNRVMKNGDSPFYAALEFNCHSKIICELLRQGVIVNFNHSDIDRIMNKKNYNSKLQRIIIQYAAKCNLFKQGKGIVNFSFEKMNKQQVQDYKNCVEELETLKIFCVFENMPLLNLIEGPVTSHYILNDHLSGLFETGIIANSFPMFYEVLRDRCKEEREKYELILKASSSLQTLMKFNEQSYDLIYRNILRYLKKSDLRNLASLTNMDID